ncbi:short-chain fatty acid transporter [Rhodovibrio salinarum]|uniref:Short-chain fatty acid transporter n=1 Tax=Rhodovibrio salinarum TaxID=1087 RepID=A0A934QJD5_9PROT|nr:short-chain fatty acid transporter [Rhodovibrio salinarum]MBK1698153.1 short-chain fatty acid transporter [Rhodovibrio salinarum]
MLRTLTRGSVYMVERYLPDPYIFVLLLTLVVFAAGMGIEQQSPLEMVQYWGNGFWNLLTFGMQMVLVLVTGYVLASSPPFKRLLQTLARLASTPGQAIVLVTVVSMIAAWINWGFGLVIGALFARQLAQVVPRVDYRLLIASAYTGFLVWHGGLASSVGLVIATEGHFAQDQIGVVPTSETIFSSFNLLLVLSILIVIPVVNRMMMPPADRAVTVDPQKLAQEEAQAPVTIDRPADRLENSVILAQAVGLLGLAFLVYYFVAGASSLNLNIVNFAFLFLGIMLHGRPSSFLNAVQEAVKGAGGIVIQFPFYAGIMAMMIDSGLAESLSNLFVAASNEVTFPLFTFLSAGIVNMFVPSGGGQWAVQAPVMLDAAERLGVSVPRTAMAVAWGDAWTNMIQPFWALPALAIAGLNAKDIMGYCLVVLLVSGVIMGAGLMFFP